MDVISHLFTALCGQAAAHSWAPGGVELPVCQRCAGLYVGAAFAALLHFWCRPRLSGHFLAVHGVFLLLMVPFGFHWVPQGPGLRAVSGVLFAFGLVAFLRLPLGKAGGMAGGDSLSVWPALSGSWRYFTGVMVTTFLVPFLGASGSAVAGWSLALAACAGALVLASLAAANVAAALNEAVQFLLREPGGRAGA